jgi:hypothetical protein
MTLCILQSPYKCVILASHMLGCLKFLADGSPLIFFLILGFLLALFCYNILNIPLSMMTTLLSQFHIVCVV